jgi:SPX domain
VSISEGVTGVRDFDTHPIDIGGYLITMKFGKNLPRNQVPEWSHSYIRYRALKKLIGKVVDSEKQGLPPDTTGMPDLSSICLLGLG